ncbi:MAG: hypothetical protein JWM19_4534 [Actinomycetia bacterium]|nr:hypothetical protein [Actinomycetes bacterium]
MTTCRSVLRAEAIRDVLTDVDDIDQAAEVFLQQTHEAGASDNVTVLAVDLPEGSLREREGSPVALGAAGGLSGWS